MDGERTRVGVPTRDVDRVRMKGTQVQDTRKRREGR
jgi:hypothetical protein